MADNDLAAEIAEHRPDTSCAVCMKRGDTPFCADCGEVWPCLVKRLADRLDNLVMVSRRFYEALDAEDDAEITDADGVAVALWKAFIGVGAEPVPESAEASPDTIDTVC